MRLSDPVTMAPAGQLRDGYEELFGEQARGGDRISYLPIVRASSVHPAL